MPFIEKFIVIILLSLTYLSAVPLYAGDSPDIEFNISNSTVFAPGSEINISMFSNVKQEIGFHFKLFKITDYDSFIIAANHQNESRSFDIFGKNGLGLLQYTKLIKEWSSIVNTADNDWDNHNLKVGRIDEPGNYILQVTRDNKVVYCGIAVTNLTIIYKNSRDMVLAYAADAKSGKALPDVKFKIYDGQKLTDSVDSDKKGLAVMPINSTTPLNGKELVLTATTEEETIFSNPYFYSMTENRYIGYIYTNQPVYRPGQTVNLKAILRDRYNGELINLPGQNYEVKITSPKGRIVFSDSVKSNEFGSISAEFILEKDADPGFYNISIINGRQYYWGSFNVEEYKKPEYEISVKPGKNNYAVNDTIKAVISANYYFGSPVTSGNVQIKIFRQNIWHPWWFGSDYGWFYKNYDNMRTDISGAGELIHSETMDLGKDGKLIFNYKIGSKIDKDFIYVITAEVTDNSRNTVSGSAEVHVTRGSFTISAEPGKSFAVSGSPVNLRINTYDFSDKPVPAKFSVVFLYPEQERQDGTYYRPLSDTLSGTTDSLGKAVVTFLPKGFYQGSYNYTVFAFDEKGRKITETGYFNMGTYEDYKNNGSIEILTDKDAYSTGDTLTAVISLPQKDVDVLITYDKNSFLGYELCKAESNNVKIKIKLTENYSPGFNISAAFVKDGQLFSFSKMVGVLDKSRFLNITLTASAKKYKPGDKVNYKISVKDIKGSPVKNTELSVGIIDESIYAIKEEQVQDIKSFFYQPQYYNIPAFSSRQNIHYAGYGRDITLIDKAPWEKGYSPAGDGSLHGRISSHNINNIDKALVLLSSDSYYYKTAPDTAGVFTLSGIKQGDYNIYILLDYGRMINAGKIIIGKYSEKDINLSEYNNPGQDNVLFSGMGSGARGIKITKDLLVSPHAEGRLMEKAAGDFVQPQLRSNFVDAALWKAHIVTDENGEAEVSFVMPDNLTEWRATARGITTDSKVGQSVDNIISRKNLLVRMETPRFFREGDEIVVSTIVHNYLEEKKQVKINFYPGSLQLLGSGINTITSGSGSKKSYDINIDKNSEVRIDWKLKVAEPVGDAVLKAEALTNEESDAVELKVPVQPYGIKQVENITADNSESGTTNLRFSIPQNTNLKTAKLSFSVAPSLAGTLLKALDDLAGYPYGCVEQTMSRFLPTLIAENTFKEIHAPLKSSTINELPKMVESGLKRLYNFQHDDGGWGWWTGGQSNPYMTAYVIYGMSIAKHAGYAVDAEAFNNGLTSLEGQIGNMENLDFTTRAFMFYSYSNALKLSGKGIDSVKKDMIVKLAGEHLNPYALSLTALALNNIGDSEMLQKVLLKLSKSAIDEKSTAHWSGKSWHYSWQEDKVQSTAYAVKALMLDKNYSPLVTKAARWLVQQKQGFSWHSTQETATVIFALTDYLKTTNELNPEFTASVYVNNKKAFEKKFAADDVYTNSQTIEIEGALGNNLKPGINNIKIEKEGTGKLYFSGLSSFYTEKRAIEKSDDKFKVARTYYLLSPIDEGNRIVYEKKRFEGAIKSGQVLFVQTTVESKEKDLQYFILEDMLPSGFEAVKDENNYSIPGEDENAPVIKRRFPVIPPFYADKEYHDDRVSFFVTDAKDRMEFSYIIRAQVPGKINVNPASAYLMYYPELNGYSIVQKIEVKD